MGSCIHRHITASSKFGGVDFCIRQQRDGEFRGLRSCLGTGRTLWGNLGTKIGRHGAYGARHLHGIGNVPLASKEYPERRGHGGVYHYLSRATLRTDCDICKHIRSGVFGVFPTMVFVLLVREGVGTWHRKKDCKGRLVNRQLQQRNTTCVHYIRQTRNNKKSGIWDGHSWGFFVCFRLHFFVVFRLSCLGWVWNRLGFRGFYGVLGQGMVSCAFR